MILGRAQCRQFIDELSEDCRLCTLVSVVLFPVCMIYGIFLFIFFGLSVPAAGINDIIFQSRSSSRTIRAEFGEPDDECRTVMDIDKISDSLLYCGSS